MRKMHLKSAFYDEMNINKSYCGILTDNITYDKNLVTCKTCKKKMDVPYQTSYQTREFIYQTKRSLGHKNIIY